MYMYLSLTEHVLVHVHNIGKIIIQYIVNFSRSKNLCEFPDLHVFLFGKIIVVSIPDNVLQSQIHKKHYEN